MKVYGALMERYWQGRPEVTRGINCNVDTFSTTNPAQTGTKPGPAQRQEYNRTPEKTPTKLLLKTHNLGKDLRKISSKSYQKSI
jgi:hypothetical protein